MCLVIVFVIETLYLFRVGWCTFLLVVSICIDCYLLFVACWCRLVVAAFACVAVGFAC